MKQASNSAARRLGWMVVIWLGSVASLGLVALGMRALMRLAGMSH
ncbi:DUF2474 domain-containing protein [Alcaligenes nematophilus]